MDETLQGLLKGTCSVAARQPGIGGKTLALHEYQGMPSAYVRRFYHRELRRHGEAIAAVLLFLFSANSVSLWCIIHLTEGEIYNLHTHVSHSL